MCLLSIELLLLQNQALVYCHGPSETLQTLPLRRALAGADADPGLEKWISLEYLSSPFLNEL